MPGSARVLIPNKAHHIIQRGNNRQNVLVEEEDFSSYCYWANKYAERYGVLILAYCLMNNHVHFIAVPKDKVGISRLFNAVHMRYAQYMNYKRRTSGHLWQGRFFSCVMDDAHLYQAIRYVEQNPVRARMVQYPWDYAWSSAKWHVQQEAERYIKVKNVAFIDQKDWKSYLMSKDEGVNARIREATQKGKAVAREEFIAYWENVLKCSLKSLKPGPRPKSQN